MAKGLLPLGLAQNVTLDRDVPAGTCVRWNDVSIDGADPIVRFRREMEAAFGNTSPADG